MEYNRNDPATTIVPYIFLFKNKRTIKDNQERANQYTDLFGWHKNPVTTRRKDIRTPTVKWMHLMYQIEATLLQACVVLHPADEKAGAHNFIKFNPYCIDGVTEKYIPSTRPVWPKSGPRTKERSWKDGELESEGRRKATLLG